MDSYKHIDTSQRFITVDLGWQLLLGTFEHALNHLINHELDLSGFDARYRNNLTGAAADPPTTASPAYSASFPFTPRCLRAATKVGAGDTAFTVLR